MPFNIVLDDISRMDTDCIVNATNSSLIYGGYGVDYAVHRAAGPELEDACAVVAPCPVGEVRVTDGFKLKAKYIIHTVGPVWKGKKNSDYNLLDNCYRNALSACIELGCSSIAMPLISAGTHGFPNALVLKTAAEICKEYLEKNELDIYLVVYSRRMIEPDTDISRIVREHFGEASRRPESNICASPRKNAASNKQINQNCLDNSEPDFYYGRKNRIGAYSVNSCANNVYEGALPPSIYEKQIVDKISDDYSYKEFPDSVTDIKVDESFGQTVSKLAEQFFTPSEFYRRANITKQIYSKMKNDPEYKPSRSTALACAIVLKEKGVDENELLSRAGMALSSSDKRDKIVRIALDRHIYDILEINMTLFEYDLSLLGSA